MFVRVLSIGWCVLVLVLIRVAGGNGIRSCCFVLFEWRSLPAVQSRQGEQEGKELRGKKPLCGK